MVEAKMQLVDWIDDLAVRFLVNLPTSELSSIPRLCFQIEEAQWYYEDFVRPLAAASGQQLPGLHLRQFCLLLFQNCPLTSNFTDAEHLAAYETFLAYKVRVPVRGAILLNDNMDRVVLVRGWKKGSSWSFPRGKINKDEKDLDCAIREVDEETGYNVREAGLVPEREEDAKYIDITMREQHMRMFVFRNVPLDTHFEPRTRKEISKIDWYNLRDLPGYARKAKGAQHDPAHEALQANKFYMVAPFLGPLKKWIGQQRQQQAGHAAGAANITAPAVEYETDDAHLDISQHLSNDARSEELRRLLSIGGPQTQTGIGPHLAPSQATVYNPFPTTPAEQVLPQAVQPSAYQPNHLPHFPAGPLAGHQQASPSLQSQHSLLSLFQPGNVKPGQGHIAQQQHFPPAQHQLPVPAPHASLRTSHEDPSTGPAPPKPSQLPTPNLNAHALKLLETLKQGGKATAQNNNTKPGAENNAHQAKLLGLFKQPTPQPEQGAGPPPINIAKTASTDASQLATAAQELQAAFKEAAQVQSTKAATVNVQKTRGQNDVQKPQPKHKPGARENSNAHPRATSGNQQQRNHTPVKSSTPIPEYTLLKRPKNDRKPVNVQGSPVPQIIDSAQGATTNSDVSNAQPNAFKILARPGSAKGITDSTPATPFQPQLLKRSDQTASSPPPRPALDTGITMKATPKQNLLLDLFNKSPAISPATASIRTTTQAHSPSTPMVNAAATTPAQSTPIAESTGIPDAPTLAPETKPKHIAGGPQNNLLELFKNQPSVATSQDSPISPFALGSPGVPRHFVANKALPGQARPNLAANERKGSGSETPTEAKGFLLGYLNDLVKREGKKA